MDYDFQNRRYQLSKSLSAILAFERIFRINIMSFTVKLRNQWRFHQIPPLLLFFIVFFIFPFCLLAFCLSVLIPRFQLSAVYRAFHTTGKSREMWVNGFEWIQHLVSLRPASGPHDVTNICNELTNVPGSSCSLNIFFFFLNFNELGPQTPQDAKLNYRTTIPWSTRS